MIFDQMFNQRSLENPATPITGQTLQEYLEPVDGISVNNVNAMTLGAVYSCIYVIASSLAQIPLNVMRVSNGRREKATDHPAYWILHDEPNEWQTSYKWRETTQGHVLGWGNGFSQVIRSPRGELRSVEMRRPWEVELVKNGSRWIYSVVDEETTHAFAVQPEDMVHVRALGSDGRTGKSLIRQHADTIGLGLAAQRYGKDFFDGGGRPTGLVTVKNQLKDDSWQRLKTVWASAVAKLRQSDNKTLMLPADLDYKSITIPPEDAQFLDTQKMNRSVIAGIFNVPAHMINDLDNATFSNISEQAIQFVRYTMMPWIKNWEDEINRRIFTLAERKAGYYAKFNLSGLLRGTAAERTTVYHNAINDGWLTRNEVRDLEDLNPIDGLDEMLVSVNAVPLSQLGTDSTSSDGTPPAAE